MAEVSSPTTGCGSLTGGPLFAATSDRHRPPSCGSSGGRTSTDPRGVPRSDSEVERDGVHLRDGGRRSVPGAEPLTLARARTVDKPGTAVDAGSPCAVTSLHGRGRWLILCSDMPRAAKSRHDDMTPWTT